MHKKTEFSWCLSVWHPSTVCFLPVSQSHMHRLFFISCIFTDLWLSNLKSLSSLHPTAYLLGKFRMKCQFFLAWIFMTQTTISYSIRSTLCFWNVFYDIWLRILVCKYPMQSYSSLRDLMMSNKPSTSWKVFFVSFCLIKCYTISCTKF